MRRNNITPDVYSSISSFKNRFKTRIPYCFYLIVDGIDFCFEIFAVLQTKKTRNKTQTNHNSVGVITFVSIDLCSSRHTFYTEIEIEAHSTFDPDFARNVFLAIIAVVFRSSLGTLNCLHKNSVIRVYRNKKWKKKLYRRNLMRVVVLPIEEDSKFSTVTQILQQNSESHNHTQTDEGYWRLLTI